MEENTNTKPSTAIEFDKTTTVATMEKAVDFINSYLNFNNDVPKMAQIKLSVFAEMKTETGKRIEKLKKLKEHLANSNDLTSMESFNILVEMNTIMQECKKLNQEKNIVAMQIFKLLKKSSKNVKAKCEVFMQTQTNDDEQNVEETSKVDKQDGDDKNKKSLRSSSNKGQTKCDNSKFSAKYPKRRVSMLPKNYTAEEDPIEEYDIDSQLKKVEPVHLQEKKLQSLSKNKLSKNRSPKNKRNSSGSAKSSPRKSPHSKKGSSTKKTNLNMKRVQKKDEKIEKLYCFCREESHGGMIACDGANCKYEWFHYDCVGLVQAPPKNQSWYCDDCKKGLRGLK